MKRKTLFNIFANTALFFALVAISIVSFMPANKSETTQTASARLLAIYEGSRSGKNVSLMINVYWGTEFVEQMLEVLKNKGVVTTFFIGGSWAAENEELVKKISESGHEIANHGYNHKNHDNLSQDANKSEISACHAIVKSLLGIEMNLFAPPSGAYSDATISAATSLGYKTIMWTRDTIDWRDHNTSLIYQRAISGIKGGDLILMHPTANTLAALPQIIDTILAKGLTVNTVSNTLQS